ncbi:MAG TPA: hypothetical protein VKM55_29270 [Candidatus Lokiarchaeia archaeon]|nr:hypothetical protein [Candidatus Lokiarchaeia archaeon]
MNQVQTHDASRVGSARHGIAREIFMVLFLCFSIAVMFVYPLVGYALDHGRFDWFFTGEVFGPSRITFLQAIMDVDDFLANFVSIVLFCLVSAFFFVYYGPSRVEAKIRENSTGLKKAAWIFGVATIGIFIIAVIVSYSNVVNDHPEFDGQGLVLAISNFYPENFSVHALYYAFIFSGFPGIFYMIASGNLQARQLHWIPDRKNSGILFMIIAAVIVEILVIASPIVPWDMINASTSVREMIFSLFDVLFITGLILLVESKTKNHIENQGIISQWVMPRYWIHEIAWAIPVFAVLGIVGYLLVGQSMLVQISVVYYLSRAWSFGFAVCFTLFLYFLGRAIVDSRRGTEAN